MTTILITFAFNFTQHFEHKKENEKETKRVKQIESLKSFEESTETELTTVEVVKKPIRFLHIEYLLLPGKNIYKIDVVFWGTVAKVYTKDGTKAMKSINKNGHHWIAFSIDHRLVLDDNDLIKFKSHVANFSVSTNKSRLSFSESRKATESTFYFEEEAIRLKSDFAEAFQTDPNLNVEEIDLKTRNINDVKYILDDLLNFPTKNEPMSDLHIIPGKNHKTKVLKIVQTIAVNKEVYGVNDIDHPLDVEELLAVTTVKVKAKHEKKEIGKKQGKGTKDTVKHVDTAQILIQGEAFFTNVLKLYNLQLNNRELRNSFAVIEVQNLITSKQRSTFHPMIIKINKIINIPKDILIEHGFTFMYLTYNICEIILHTTGARPIEKQIYFVDNHIYFFDEEQVQKIAEMIQNNCLLIKIYGIRPQLPEKPATMFGENINDIHISEPLQNNQAEVRKYIEGDKEASKKSVLLAITRVKLNELLHPVWRFKRLESCIHPRHLSNLDENYNRLEKATPNTLNIEYSNIFEQNPLTENILISYGMCMDIAVQVFSSTINVIDDLIENRSMYNRIMLHILNVSIAKSFLFNIYVHNAHWLEGKYIVPDYLSYNLPVRENFEKHIITGFSIGCIDDCLMFLEGTKKWIYKLIWCSIRREKRHAVKVVYNSNFIYEKRLYLDFIQFGGVYFASMYCSPYQLLINNKTFTRGYLPEPVRRALQKFDLIRKCTRMEQLTDNVLPTTKELLSLGLEWGVPFHWPVNKKLNSTLLNLK